MVGLGLVAIAYLMYLTFFETQRTTPNGTVQEIFVIVGLIAGVVLVQYIIPTIVSAGIQIVVRGNLLENK